LSLQQPRDFYHSSVGAGSGAPADAANWWTG
jgi:hypothetical protein